MLRPLTLLLACIGLLAGPLSATWSIILVNVRTGEIAVASATCIPGFDLAAYVPVIVVGKGAGAAQSSVDVSGANRLLIRDQLRLGTDPVQILAMLAQSDTGHQGRQYGIVDVSGRAIGFSGTGDGAYAGDRRGRVGDVVYAIQGNVLTGGAVLAAAELALYNTQGDIGEMMMAAMEAARGYGGDGRCSCTEAAPTSCGAPPPNFVKSSDVAFMIVARGGDVDGGCNATAGCATGSYYMRLNVAFRQRTDPDPVLLLRQQYDQWKVGQRGRPDHYLSTVVLGTATLPIDGVTSTLATVRLVDREGTPLTVGGALVTPTLDASSTAAVTFGSVTDHGDGTYTFPVVAGTQFGTAKVRVAVDDGNGPRELGPPVNVAMSRELLWTDRTELSASTGGTLHFAVQPGALFGANKTWVLLASMSGTSPGILIPPFYQLPLNPDALFNATLYAAFSGIMPELSGVTSPLGVSSTAVTFPPGVYGLPVGTNVAWAWAFVNPTTLTSRAVTVRIVQ